MRTETRRLAQLGVIAVVAAITFAACSSTGAAKDDLLSKVKAAGKIVMSTDPEYPPQSALTPSGSYEGFDIDVGTEIAKRLGVDIAFRDAELGSAHGRFVERALGLQRRLDDDHQRPSEGPRLHQAVLLHPGPDGRPVDRRHHHAGRARRQDHLRRPGHDVPAVAGRNPRLRDREPPDEATGRVHRDHAPDGPQLRRSLAVGPPRLRRLAELLDHGRWGHQGRPSGHQDRRSGLQRAARRRRSTRAAPTRRPWWPRSTRSSTPCIRTERSRPCPRSGSART